MSSLLSDYYLVRAWLEMNQPEPTTLNRPVKKEPFDVVSPNPYRAGLLVHNASSVSVSLAFADDIDSDEYSTSLDPGQSYHLEDAGFFRCPKGTLKGLASSSDDDGRLQITEWAHDSRQMPNLRQLLRDIEEKL